MSSLAKRLESARAQGQPLLMGVVNLTPDSFYDGGRHSDASAAERHIDNLLQAGADIIDLGAESSRPGAEAVAADEQLRRLGGSVAYAVSMGALVSVDTTHPEVADAVLQQGAALINDVSCLREPLLARAVADHGAWLVLTHSVTPMSQMADFSAWPDDHYEDIVRDVAQAWGQARQKAVDVGVNLEQVVFDPGLGFSKNARQSFLLLRELRAFRSLGAPILVGVGRKSFIAAADPSPPEGRLAGTLAASLAAWFHGADMLRMHDVFEMRQAIRVIEAIRHPAGLTTPPRVSAPAASDALGSVAESVVAEPGAGDQSPGNDDALNEPSFLRANPSSFAVTTTSDDTSVEDDEQAF